MSGKAAVPMLRSGHAPTDAFAQAVKQNMDWLTGQQKNSPPLFELPSTATLSDVIVQVNQVIKRLS